MVKAFLMMAVGYSLNLMETRDPGLHLASMTNDSNALLFCYIKTQREYYTFRLPAYSTSRRYYVTSTTPDYGCY